MADNDEKKKQPPGDDEMPSLKDELHIEDLSRCIFFKDQKIFAAAGPDLPLLQMNDDGTFISLNPALPYRQEVHEEVVTQSDEYGRLYDALGQLRRLTGMKYKGRTLYFVTARHPENGQNLAAWFDDDMKPHCLFIGENVLSAIMVMRIRDRMIDGELSRFDEISSN